MLYNSHVKATAGGECLRFLFDTGNASNNACYLYAAYCNSHREVIDEVATTDTISGGGYGSAGEREMKVILQKSRPLMNIYGHDNTDRHCQQLQSVITKYI